MNLYAIRNALSQGKRLNSLPLRVTYYGRVSTDQDAQLNSLENQKMFFENYIKSEENWIYVPGYVDEGISGTSVNKRDNFLRMIEDAKKGKFDLILTKEISRFSRNTVDSIQYSQELLSYNVGIYFLNDNINTFDPDSELRLTIMASVAQDEIRKLSERVRFGLKRSVEKGVVIGNDNIYGYKKDKGKLVIVEDEAEMVRLIFNEYSKGQMGTGKLGHHLYDEYNIVSKTNKPLSSTAIARIIRNPKYKGFYCGHKESVIDYHSKKRVRFNEKEWVTFKDHEKCPPIVSEELWEKCNKILRKNSKNYETKTPTNSKYALSGKIKCFHDGATFVKGCYKNKKTGIKSNFWGCSNYRKYGRHKKNGCSTPIIHYEELLDIFKKMLSFIIKNQQELISEIYSLINEYNTKTDYSKQLQELDLKIAEIKEARAELINMRARKELDGEEYTNAKEKYNIEIENLNKKKEYYLEKNEEIDCDSNINDFENKIKNIIMSDDESIFSIVSSIIDNIFVERIEDEDSETQKVMLHFKLNIIDSKKSYENSSLNLNDFLLLFGNSEGLSCCFS